METEDIAYLAGIVDGEGCISVMRLSRGNRSSATFMARISVAMTSEKIVRWIKATTEVGTVHVKCHQPGRKKQWLWLVNSRNAVGLLRTLLPFLKLKKPQARNAVALQRVLRRSSGGAKLTRREVATRTRLYKISRKLNGGRTRGKL